MGTMGHDRIPDDTLLKKLNLLRRLGHKGFPGSSQSQRVRYLRAGDKDECMNPGVAPLIMTSSASPGAMIGSDDRRPCSNERPG